MTVESVTHINDLDVNNPAGGDSISEGDNHIRNIKKAIKNTFPNVDEAVTATASDINKLSDFVRTGNGVFASCKYSSDPIRLMYAHNVSSVQQLGTNGYKVFFVQPTDGFDHHYSVQITPISTTQRPVTCQVTDQRAEWVAFTVAEWDGNNMAAPQDNIGFYMTMVDMIQTEANANT